MGVDFEVKYLYGYKIASYNSSEQKCEPYIEKFVKKHLTKLGFEFRKMRDSNDNIEFMIFDEDEDDRISFWEDPINMNINEKYKLTQLGDNMSGDFNSYFIVLREMASVSNKGDKEFYTVEMVNTEEIEEFHKFLHDELGIRIEDINAKCNFYMVPEVSG